jgi:hypothetical protein
MHITAGWLAGALVVILVALAQNHGKELFISIAINDTILHSSTIL